MIRKTDEGKRERERGEEGHTENRGSEKK